MRSTVASVDREIFLEPPRGLEIEMVRRLVEQQHVGRRHELSREAEAPALAAAQPLERSSARVDWIEPESVEHRIDARRDRVAALALESLEILRVSLEYLVAHCRVVLSDPASPDPTSDFSSASNSANWPAAASHTVVASPKSRCCSSSDTRKPGLACDCAARRLHLAGEQPEERRLSGAVAADDSPALAGADVNVIR